MNSVLKMIFDHLLDKGFEVYFPGQKTGECKSKYIVLKEDGVTKITGISSKRQFYSLMLYVPLDEYCDIEDLKRDVKTAMKELYPLVVESDSETPTYTDTNGKSHMVSIMYHNNRKK